MVKARATAMAMARASKVGGSERETAMARQSKAGARVTATATAASKAGERATVTAASEKTRVRPGRTEPNKAGFPCAGQCDDTRKETRRAPTRSREVHADTQVI
jgi:hypothetical protein